MAKIRKTLKEKKQAALRQQKQVSAGGTGGFAYTTRVSTPSAKKSKIDDNDLLIVPSHYVVTDLKKTIALSLLFISLIGVAYWYLNMGGSQIIQPAISGIFKR